MHEMALRMPKLSMTMERGDVASWLRSVGEVVRAGEVVCTVVTDKTEMEVEAPVDGELTRIVAKAGDTIEVGEPICYFATESEDFIDALLDTPGPLDQMTAPPAPAGPTTRPLGPGEQGVALGPPSSPDVLAPRSMPRIVPAVPAARRRAGELGVVLARVTGSGPGGVVTLTDVESAARQSATAPIRPAPSFSSSAASSETLRPPGALHMSTRARSIHNRTVEAMVQSAAVPQFTLYRRVGLDAVDKRRGRIGWTAIFAAALSHALRQVPRLNGTYDPERGVLLHDEVRLAIAIDTPDGLVAPIVRDPDTRTLDELAAELKDLTERAMSAKLHPKDLEAPTATLSNLGPFGIEMFQALVTPPQAAALSIGAAKREIVANEDGFGFHLGCWVGLSCDHRVANGADGARLLAAFSALLETPPTSETLSFGPRLSPPIRP